MTTPNKTAPAAAVDLMAALKASLTAAADRRRERTLALQNIADAEWDRAQRTGVTSLKKCPDCAHRIFQHDQTDDAVSRNCRDCNCDRYARVV
jgi:hypothetical protein